MVFEEACWVCFALFLQTLYWGSGESEQGLEVAGGVGCGVTADEEVEETRALLWEWARFRPGEALCVKLLDFEL